MVPVFHLDPENKSPLYKQLHAKLKDQIEAGSLTAGARLPATRELAGQLGLNRTTVSAAYDLLESEGLIKGHVGRGSFVVGDRSECRLAWTAGALASPSPAAPAATPLASFSSSRPSELLFPLDEFRATCAEVIASADAQAILQLGSPSGYPPLRRYLLEQSRTEGVATRFRRHPHHQRLPAGVRSAAAHAGPEWRDRAASKIPSISEFEMFLNARRTLIGVPVGRQRHRSGNTGARHRSRASAPGGRDFEFPESDRRHYTASLPQSAAAHHAGCRRHRHRKRHLRRSGLRRRFHPDHQAAWTKPATRSCCEAFRRSLFPACASAG